ncbi:MAG: hypothetical protein ACM31L_09735 [Actinomycetota bacterium]
MRVTESERLFLHELHSIRKDPLGKRIIHFFVSLAPQAGEMAKKIEGAKQFIRKAFAKSPYCETFHAHNGDIFVTYSHISVSEVLATCAKVEKAFFEDGVVSVRNVYGEYAFYKVFDVVKDLDKVFNTFKTIIAQAQVEPEKYAKRPMTPENLSFLLDKVRNSDVRACIFNQPVYNVGHKVPSIEFLEFYVASQQIESVYLPDTSISGSPWLFAALKEEYDRVILRAMAGELGEYRHKAFSVNISLGTVLSREFGDFIERLPSKLAGKIVLEVHKTDLAQNFSLYREVRALAEERKLKVCVDGLEWRDFELMCLNKLKPHYMKVLWSAELLSAEPDELHGFVDAVRNCNGTEVVLSRCDNPKAFPFAKTLGIRYVQGKLADQYFKSGMEL